MTNYAQKSEKYLTYSRKLQSPYVYSSNPFHTLQMFSLFTGKEELEEQVNLGVWPYPLTSLFTHLKEVFKRDNILLCETVDLPILDELVNMTDKYLRDLKMSFFTLDLVLNIPVSEMIEQLSQKNRGVFSSPPSVNDGSSYLEDHHWGKLCKIIEKNPKITELIFRNNGRRHRLLSLAESISKSSIRRIDLTSFPVFDEDLPKLCSFLSVSSSLQSLVLSGNNLTNKALIGIKSFLVQTNVLSLLDLSVNKIDDEGMQILRDGLLQNKSLQALFLWENQLTDASLPYIEQILQHHFPLKKLNLHGNNFSFRGLSHLVRPRSATKVWNIRTLMIPIENHSSAKQLESFSEKETINNIHKFIDESDESENLDKETIENCLIGVNCKFQEIPFSSIRIEWKFIKYLCLSRNEITEEFGEQIECLKGLKYLDLSYNRLTQIPSSITRLYTIKILDIRGNQILRVPYELSNLNKMKRLLFQDNQLQEFPLDILPRLEKIEFIGLEGNQIDTKLENVIKEYLKGGKKELRVSGKELKHIPYGVFYFKGLTTLELTYTSISIIPPEIGCLLTLEVLLLNNNCLSDLPWQLVDLSNLIKLNLKDNPLEKLNDFVGNLDDIKYVFDYLEERKNRLMSAEVNTCRIRIMVVGEENVGKTSVGNLLQQEKEYTEGGVLKRMGSRLKFETKVQTLSTDGIDISSWTHEPKQKPGTISPSTANSAPTNVTPSPNVSDANDQKQSTESPQRNVFHFSLYDYGGQEIYLSTHTFFLSKNGIYLIVFNIMKPMEENFIRIDYWVSTIGSLVRGSAQIIIVATHTDDSRCTTKHLKHVETVVMQKYKLKLIPVSCKTKKGINELREEIKRLGQKLPFYQKKVKENLLCLEERLIQIRDQKDIIKIDEIESLLQLFGYEESEFNSIVQYFCDVGTLFYLPGDDNQFIVLNPQWLSKLISTLVTTKTNFVKNGKLQRVHLSQLWRPPTYPNNLHGVLLDLLESLNMVYRQVTPESAESEKGPKSYETLVVSEEYRQNKWNELLIPHLLPEDGVDYGDNFSENRESICNFRYIVEVLPRGVLASMLTSLMKICKAEFYSGKSFRVRREENQAVLFFKSSDHEIELLISKNPFFIRYVLEKMEIVFMNVFKRPSFSLQIGFFSNLTPPSSLSSSISSSSSSSKNIKRPDEYLPFISLQQQFNFGQKKLELGGEDVEIEEIAPHIALDGLYNCLLEPWYILSPPFEPSTDYSPFIEFLQQTENDQFFVLTLTCLDKTCKSFGLDIALSYLHTHQSVSQQTILEKLIHLEVSNSVGGETLFREETPAVIYLHGTIQLTPCVEFTKSISKNILSIARELGCSFEINPNFDLTPEQVEENLSYFLKLCNLSLDFLISTLDSIPRIIKNTCYMIRTCLETCGNEKFSQRAELFVGSFFFLRYINPTFISPDFQIQNEVEDHVKRGLLYLSKVFQTLSNRTTFTESFMKPCQIFIEERTSHLSEFLKNLSSTYEEFEDDFEFDKGPLARYYLFCNYHLLTIEKSLGASSSESLKMLQQFKDITKILGPKTDYYKYYVSRLSQKVKPTNDSSKSKNRVSFKGKEANTQQTTSESIQPEINQIEPSEPSEQKANTSSEELDTSQEMSLETVESYKDNNENDNDSNSNEIQIEDSQNLSQSQQSHKSPEKIRSSFHQPRSKQVVSPISRSVTARGLVSKEKPLTQSGSLWIFPTAQKLSTSLSSPNFFSQSMPIKRGQSRVVRGGMHRLNLTRSTGSPKQGEDVREGPKSPRPPEPSDSVE